MKAASTALDTHLQGEVTTLATCWQMTRVDGTLFSFTAHDQPLPVDVGDGNGELIYTPNNSYNRSAVSTNDQLSVDNLDLTGVLTDDSIDETELRRGLFDYAQVAIFIVNWDDLSQGILKIRYGWIGEVVITPNGFFSAELRGLDQALQRTAGELYAPLCRADLGDARCRVPILPPVTPRGTLIRVGEYFRMTALLNGVVTPTLQVSADVNLVDESPNAANPVVGTQAARTTATVHIGAGAVEFSPSGSVNPSQAFLEYPNISAYQLSNNDFTLECFYNFKDLTSAAQVFMSGYSNVAGRSWYLARSSGNVEFAYYAPGYTGVLQAVTWDTGVWHHLAVTRNATDLKIFLDGVQLGATHNIGTATIAATTDPFRLGKLRSSGFDDLPLDGFLDQVRFVNGSSLYDSNFSPPTGPFPTAESVIDGALCPDYDGRVYRVTTEGVTETAAYPLYNTTLAATSTDGTAVLTAEQAWSACITVSAVDTNSLRKKFTVTQLTPNSGGGTPGRDNFPTGSMDGGVVTFETGANAGVSMEVRAFTGDDGVTIEQEIELLLDIPFDIQVGDTGRVYRGCFKRLTDCRDIFDNVLNRRAEDYIPGQDFLFNYPDAKA